LAKIGVPINSIRDLIKEKKKDIWNQFDKNYKNWQVNDQNGEVGKV
jgi:hypothetical protein